MPFQGLAFVGISESTVTKSHLNASEVMTENSGSSTLFMSETGAVLSEALDKHRNLGAFPVTSTVRVCLMMLARRGLSNQEQPESSSLRPCRLGVTRSASVRVPVLWGMSQESGQHTELFGMT